MSGGVLRLEVPAQADGWRLDAFLAAAATELTRSAWKRRIEEGGVAVDGRVISKAGLALKPGMSVRAELPPRPSEGIVGAEIPVTVVAEDDHMAVIVKPAGLVVHPGHGTADGTLVHALVGRGMPLAPAGGPTRPGIVHRLDKDTSGLLVVAKTDAAYRALVASFARREVEKTYVAAVWGRPHPAAGRIDEAIGRSRKDRTRMAVRSPGGRTATTLYRTTEALAGATLLEVDLVTGRTHQIRVHLAARRHPVIGDTRYGGAPWRRLRDAGRRAVFASFHRLALHAAALAFPHPVTARPLAFEAPLPADFAALLETLRSKP